MTALLKPLYGYIAAGVLALLVASHLYLYWKGHADGADKIQSRWDKAEAAALTNSIEARDEAAASVPPLTEAERAVDAAIVPHTQPCRVQDKWDRDCH